ncbi:MAG: VOC family protein [Thermomicrobiales bacterium]|nr:VOC family protein [Thermomicrobiales bacterium]
MAGWATGVTAITLFVEDIEATKRFYQEIFEQPLMFEDSVSAAFKFGDLIVNLLANSEAEGLIGPALVATAAGGSRIQLTITVEDVDAVCADLVRRGVALINGPMDRPWGIRTACFRDPAGHVWEVAS